MPETVVASFRENAVSGEELASLSDEDLTDLLHCTALQTRKIRAALTQRGVPIPASAPAPTAPAAEQAAAAPPAVAAPAPVPATPPAPAAAAVPTAAEPDPRSCFDAADLARYKQLQQSISELEGMQIAGKVAQAQQHAAGVQQRAAAVHRALPGSRQTVAEAQADVDKYEGDGWHLGKMLTGKKAKEEKLAQSRQALAAATSQLQQLEAQAAALGADVQEADRQLGAWQAKASELATAKRTLQELVGRMFAGPAWRVSPRQNELADAMRALEGQVAEAQRGVTTYGRGTQLLTSATAKLQEALQALGRTQMLGAMQMGRGMRMTAATGVPGRFQPGGMMGNVAELAIFRRANTACQEAARDTAEARSLLPGLPQVDDKLLSAARAGLFQNMLMGGMMSDMIQLAAVRKSMESVKQMVAQIQPAAAWAQGNLAVYQQQAAGLRAQIATKQGELETFRKAALQAAASS